MAREKTPEENAADNERKQLVEEKKNLKKEQQAQRKEAKRRAREIAKQEDELEDGNEGNSLLTFGATILIVALWLAVICVIIKLDIGGFGSSVVTPILKDVPVLNRILPGNSVTETTNSGAYGGYTSLQDAVDQESGTTAGADTECIFRQGRRTGSAESRSSQAEGIRKSAGGIPTDSEGIL